MAASTARQADTSTSFLSRPRRSSRSASRTSFLLAVPTHRTGTTSRGSPAPRAWSTSTRLASASCASAASPNAPSSRASRSSRPTSSWRAST